MLFSAVFFIIYLGHSYFIQLEKLRSYDLENNIDNDTKLIG